MCRAFSRKLLVLSLVGLAGSCPPAQGGDFGDDVGGLTFPGACRGEQAGAETIRLLSYNIRHGAGMDERVDLDRIAAVINRLQPDLVALQEVDNHTSRTGSVDQAAYLGELTGMEAVFGSFMEYRGGEYGMAVLSRYPIIDSTNHRLPAGAEPRTALAVRVRIPGGEELVFVGVHLYRTAEERLAQAHGILESYGPGAMPVILAGDFNSTPGSEVIALFRGAWRIPDKGENRLTFPSDEPDREIDFIVYRPNDGFEVIESRAIDEPVASDHRPVLLVLSYVR